MFAPAGCRYLAYQPIGTLESYKDEEFYEEHRAILFDRLTEMMKYEITAVFKKDIVNIKR